MTDYHVPSYVTRDAPGAYVPMTRPTCVTMPNGVISMFPDVETAKRAYKGAYPGAAHVGLMFTRTMEYIDLRGAPWIITITGEVFGSAETASANSIVYRSGKTTIDSTTTASSLESVIRMIDNFVEGHFRDSLEAPNLTHYPQSSFKDRNDDTWEVHWIMRDGKALGYFGLQYGTVVGPATSKDALKKMVERYLSRLEGERATFSKEAVTSYAEEIDPSKRVLEPPPEISNATGAGVSIKWSGVAIVAGAVALVSYIAYAAWMRGDQP